MLSKTFSRPVLLSVSMVATTAIAKRSFSISHCEGSKLTLSKTPQSIVLYQYQICPFCNRVKAVLDYLGLPYQAVEVNPLTKSEIKFSKDYKKVPIAIVDGETIVESSAIIDNFVNRIAENKSKSEFFTEDTQKWAEWSEKRLAVMLYPNITRSLEESWECFGYTSSVDTWNMPMQVVTRAAGSVAMLFASGSIKKKYNIVDERAELKKELQVWSDALGDKNFVHGNDMTMPDLMVFGVLRSIEGLQTFNEIMKDNATVKLWYDRMVKMVQRQK